jgi:tetratricopeptide (TPR) repeat protein
MTTVAWIIANLILPAWVAFGDGSPLNVEHCQVKTQYVESAAKRDPEVVQPPRMNTSSQDPPHRTGSHWVLGVAGWMGIGLAMAATLTVAAVWRRWRAHVVIGRCRRMVRLAEASSGANPERAQEAFGLAIEKLIPIRRALADRCRCQNMSDRVFFYLARPEMIRLRNDVQRVLGRAEFGIGLSLLSQRTMVEKVAYAIFENRSRGLKLLRAVARESEQLMAHLRDEAIGHLKAAVDLEPSTDEYWYALAQAYELAERNEDSLMAIQSAIVLNRSVDEYYQLLASVAWKTGAYRLYNQALLTMVETSGQGRHGR